MSAPEADAPFLRDVERIATEVAAPNADSVDREARFPRESIDALAEAGALAAHVPEELGGRGVSLPALASACTTLGRACGASAMVFAMHQIEVVTMARHLEGADFYRDYLHGLLDAPRLIASVTSEVGTGGDMGRSIAAVAPGEDGMCTFEKNAPTVSYGAHADDYFVTLRRAPDAEAGEQVIVLVAKDQTELEPTGTWDPLGMRGTCSPGFRVRARFEPERVLPTPFPQVAPESLVPVSHILWSHLWLGIATDAFERARAFVRAAARQKPDQPLPAAHRLSVLSAELSPLRAQVAAGLADFEQASAEPGRPWLTTMAAVLRFNNLKIAASEMAPRVCQGALGVSGIVGYKNDTPFSVGRHMRDTLSGALMVTNERLHQTDSQLLLIAKEV